jgi:site-specific DNA recombinase
LSGLRRRSRRTASPLQKPEQQFAYTGLLKCSHCGCAITAERKKGKYVYYHCTGFRGGCDKRAIREEKLEELLGDVVKAVAIDSATADWIIQALRESHTDEREYHAGQIEMLQREYVRLQNRIEQSYEDKLDGKISEETWRSKSAEWRERQVRVRSAIERHEHASHCYFEEGSRILELSSKAYSLWIRQDPFEKRKLLDILLSNCTFDGKKVLPEYRKPFCWIAEGARCSDWLPVVVENSKTEFPWKVA